LNLQRNKLSGSLPLLNLPNVKTLDISNNQLKDVNNLSVSNLTHLAQLFIGNNLLLDVPTINGCL
jgi:Leucine-rich repeat (LRR) protein